MSNHFQRAVEYLEKQKFIYNGPIAGGEGPTIKFEYRLKVLGIKTLLSGGDPKKYFHVAVIVTKQDSWGPKESFLEALKEYGQTLPYVMKRTIEANLDSLIIKFFNLAQYVLVDDDFKIEYESGSVITESRSMRSETRKISSDIISLIKKQENDEDSYRLPEDLTGEHFYPGTEISVDVEIKKSEDLEKPYILNANYIDGESDIEVLILYNPSFYPSLLYDLLGDLNETIRHELEHYKQDLRGELPSEKSTSKTDYYLQPHEIDAQVKGFSRISKLKNKSFDDVVKNWFDKNQDYHNLSIDEKQKIIEKLKEKYLSFRKPFK